jgi:XisH protein
MGYTIDQFHEAVKHALKKDGWLITHDPFTIQISEAVKLKIDLGAESAIAAQRDQEKSLSRSKASLPIPISVSSMLP